MISSGLKHFIFFMVTHLFFYLTLFMATDTGFLFIRVNCFLFK